MQLIVWGGQTISPYCTVDANVVQQDPEITSRKHNNKTLKRPINIDSPSLRAARLSPLRAAYTHASFALPQSVSFAIKFVYICLRAKQLTRTVSDIQFYVKVHQFVSCTNKIFLYSRTSYFSDTHS